MQFQENKPLGQSQSDAQVFLIDATPNLRSQLWYIQHDGDRATPLELGGILLTHAHTGHYTGLLQLGKEEADMRDVPVRGFHLVHRDETGLPQGMFGCCLERQFAI